MMRRVMSNHSLRVAEQWPLTPFGLAISSDRTGPSLQISSRMLATSQVGRAKGIAGVIGADSTACKGIGANSPAGDSVSSEKPGDTGPAVLAAATSFALGTSQTQEAQSK